MTGKVRDCELSSSSGKHPRELLCAKHCAFSPPPTRTSAMSGGQIGRAPTEGEGNSGGGREPRQL